MHHFSHARLPLRAVVLVGLVLSGCRPLPSAHEKVLPSGRSIEVIDDQLEGGPGRYYTLAYFTGVDPQDHSLLKEEMRAIWREVRPEAEALHARNATLRAWDRNFHKYHGRLGGWLHGDVVLCAQLRRNDDGTWEFVSMWR